MEKKRGSPYEFTEQTAFPGGARIVRKEVPVILLSYLRETGTRAIHYVERGARSDQLLATCSGLSSPYQRHHFFKPYYFTFNSNERFIHLRKPLYRRCFIFRFKPPFCRRLYGAAFFRVSRNTLGHRSIGLIRKTEGIKHLPLVNGNGHSS